MMRAGYRAMLLAVVLSGAAVAQEKATKLADDHSDWVARGVLKIIPPQPLEEELSTGPAEMYEVRRGIPALDYKPNFEAKSDTVFEKSKEVMYRRPIWNLEFSFKTVRLAQVEVPQPVGAPKNKKIWYMLYRVRNLGGHWSPLLAEEGSKSKPLSLAPAELVEGKSNLKDVVEASSRTRDRSELEKFVVSDMAENELLFNKDLPGADGLHFYPHIVLEAHEFDKEYLDRIIPAAIPVIAKRERVGRPIYDSVTISKQKIEISTPEKDNSVWGVAIWEDVDPRIDFFSIYVQGLTNAFQVNDNLKAYKSGDAPAKTRTYQRKTLQVHFWRPGDTIDETEREFKFGMPKELDPALQQLVRKKYGFQDPLDYRWIYR